MTAYCAKLGLPTEQIQQIFDCSTTEAALSLLRKLDAIDPDSSARTDMVYQALAEAIRY